MYKELIAQLRDENNCNVLDYVDDAANAIENLEEELERIKAERDMAVRDLRRCDIDCNFCAHAISYPDCDLECEHCMKNCKCAKCRNNDHWTWRGALKRREGEAG